MTDEKVEISGMKKIKMLTVITTDLRCREGISTIVYDYYKCFDLSCFTLDMVVTPKTNQEIIDRFTDIGVSLKWLPERKKETLSYMLNLKRLIKREKYDAVYIHGSSAIMLIELSVSLLSRCQCRIVHSHNTSCEHKIVDKMLRPFFHKCYTGALACSVEAGKWLFGNHKFDLVKNARDVKKYKFNADKRACIRSKLELSDDILAIGHVGNFNSSKNQAFLILVFAEVLKRYPNAKLFLMGSGDLQSKSEELAKVCGIYDHVCFMGTISNVEEILQALDVMVLPSIYEGLPLVAVEWQMAALPCLISDTVTRECTFTEFVKFKALGDGYEAWAEDILKLKDVCNRKDIAEQVVTAARKSGFDIETNATTLQNYLKKQCKVT